MRYWALFVLGILAFSAVGSIRVLADGWPSDILAFTRLFGATLIFRFIFFRGKLAPVQSRHTWLMFGATGFLMAIAFTFYLEAFSQANIADVKLLGFLDPVLVLVLAAGLLHEQVTKYSYLSAGLAVLGLFVLVAPASGAQFDGLVFAVVAMICGAGMTILIRKSEHEAPISEVLIYPFFIASALLLLKMIIFGVDLGAVEVGQWPWVLALAAFTALGYYAYDLAMKVHGAHVTDLGFRIGISIFGAILAILVNGESLSSNWWIAAVFLILSALALRVEAIRNMHPYAHRHHGHTH